MFLSSILFQNSPHFARAILASCLFAKILEPLQDFTIISKLCKSLYFCDQCIRTDQIEQTVNLIDCLDKIFPFRFIRIIRYPLYYSYSFIDKMTFHIFILFPSLICLVVISTATRAAYVFSGLSHVVFVALPIFLSIKSVCCLSIFFGFSPTSKLSFF